MGSEQFGPFAIDPAWRRRGPTAAAGVTEIPAPVPATSRVPPLPDYVPPESPAAPEPLPIPPLPTPLTRRRSAPPAAEIANPPAVPGPAAEQAEVVAPAIVFPPRPEEKPEPLPFKPDPPVRPVRRVRRRRGSWADMVLPLLAALVGLIALGGAIYLDQQNQLRLSAMSAEIAALRGALAQAPQTQQPTNDGTVDALLALQSRIAALEASSTPAAPMTAPDADAPQADAVAAATGEGVETTGSIGETRLADGPTTDCIPIGTRFVAIPGDKYPICRTTETIGVKDVSLEGVLLTSGKLIGAGETASLRFGNCALNVLTADDGFADMKVTCT